MNYRELSKEEFDAIVTGELAHQVIWFEGELIGIILDYFFGKSKKKVECEQLIFRRDGIGFQDKIEIVRGMFHLFSDQATVKRLELALKQIEILGRLRNAFAHGTDVGETEKDKLSLKVSLVSRSGKERIVQVTPESHTKYLSDLDGLLKELASIRKNLFVKRTRA